MAKKKPNTPRSRIKNALRQLWLRSRERAAALKKSGYKCVDCGVKQSAAKGKEVKLEVHHEPKINWTGITQLIFDRLLNVPQVPLCKDCHKKRHEQQIVKFTKEMGMKKHVGVYLDYHGYTIADIILCEVCNSVACDIHHIEARGMGGNPDKDVSENLIALCRDCHDKAEAGIITKEQLRAIKQKYEDLL